MARRRALPVCQCTHPCGKRGALGRAIAALVGAGPRFQRGVSLGVSQLLAGGHSTPGRSPGAARRRRFARPQPAGAAPRRSRGSPLRRPTERTRRNLRPIPRFVPPHNASRSALSGRGDGHVANDRNKVKRRGPSLFAMLGCTPCEGRYASGIEMRGIPSPPTALSSSMLLSPRRLIGKCIDGSSRQP
jgi:hypothetical protein